MPTVKLNKKVFEKLVGKKLSLSELKDRISMLGTDLEDINNDEITVEIFPNRPDLLSEQGLARALSSFIGVSTGLKKYNVKKSSEKVIIDASVKKVRPYTVCAIVKGLNLDDELIKEIIQIQEKLHITYGRNRKKVAIGIYPMEKIKFPITFFGEDPKQISFLPLESDSEMNGLQILSKHPTGREYSHLLEGKKIFPFFKDNTNSILSMPPIINSNVVGKVDIDTKDVFIECSGFEIEYLKTCLNIVVSALADMGGEIYSVEVEDGSGKYITPDLSGKKMILDINYVNKYLGLNLTEKDLKTLLSKMGHDYESGTVIYPSYRSDILHPIDLVEDVAIAYGYENFELDVLNVSTVGEEDAFEKFKKMIRRILIGLNFLEIKTYHITNELNQNTKMGTEYGLVRLESYMNQDFNVLRHWLMPSLMEILNKNLDKEYPQNIFEIGRVFYNDSSYDTGVYEKDKLALLLCGESANLTKVKQVVDYLIKMMGIENFTLNAKDHPSCIEGRSAEINLNGESIGIVAEAHPKVLENWQLINPVAAFEIDLTKLFKILNN